LDRRSPERGRNAETACRESTCDNTGIHDSITLKDYDSIVKRRFLEILLFLLLGAAVNVAVAWGYALCLSVDPTVSSAVEYSHGPESEVPSSQVDELYWWEVWKFQRAAACRVLSKYEFPHTVEILDVWPSVDEALAGCPLGRVIDCQPVGTDSRVAVIDGRGWPLLSLSSLVYCEGTPGGIMSLMTTNSPLTQHHVAQAYANCQFHVEWGISLPRPDNTAQHWVDGNYVLPLRPIWPGFAVNTLLYAALLWLFFRAPFDLRRHRRRKRGYCLKCGYDLRGDFFGGVSGMRVESRGRSGVTGRMVPRSASRRKTTSPV
jgi:hypothetical protein